MIDDGGGMFGRGMASPVVIHADAVVVWINAVGMTRPNGP